LCVYNGIELADLYSLYAFVLFVRAFLYLHLRGYLSVHSDTHSTSVTLVLPLTVTCSPLAVVPTSYPEEHIIVQRHRGR
jgi:hypothetical protein